MGPFAPQSGKQPQSPRAHCAFGLVCQLLLPACLLQGPEEEDTCAWVPSQSLPTSLAHSPHPTAPKAILPLPGCLRATPAGSISRTKQSVCDPAFERNTRILLGTSPQGGKAVLFSLPGSCNWRWGGGLACAGIWTGTCQEQVLMTADKVGPTPA